MNNNEPLVVSLKKTAHKIPEAETTPHTPDARRHSSLPFGLMATICAALAIGGGYYFFWSGVSGKDSENAHEVDVSEVRETDVALSAEVADVIAAVEKHIVLPKGEEPTVATVTDPSKLKDQTFFANAKNGYKVLIYTQARKAYLYDPTQDKLIEVAPITTEVQ